MNEPAIGSYVRVGIPSYDKGIEYVEGFLYTKDTVTDTYVIQQPLTYTTLACDLVLVTDIESIEAIDNSEMDLTGPPELPTHINENDIIKNEKKLLKLAETTLTTRNNNVSTEGQIIYDMLSKTLQCRWEGTDIIIFDQVCIHEPYSFDDIVSLDNDEEALNRVKKVYQGEQRRRQKQINKIS